MAYTDTEVEEVRIVLTMYTDAHLAGKNGRHSKAKEPMYFLPHASFRSAKRAWARARGGGGGGRAGGGASGPRPRLRPSSTAPSECGRGRGWGWWARWGTSRPVNNS